MDMDITLKPYDAATQKLTAVMYLTELADDKTYNIIKVMKATVEGYMKAMPSYTQRYKTRTRTR